MASEESRLQNFKKKGKDPNERLLRRIETYVELYIKNRDDAPLKQNFPYISEDDDHDEEIIDFPYDINTLKTLVINANSEDPRLQLSAVQAARKLLSNEQYPHINEFINSGILPTLVRCLQDNDDPLLQFEAAWALTNIAAGTSEQTKAVVDAGAVPIFLQLLLSPKTNVCEQAIWALGNVIGDSPTLRDYVISLGVIEPLLSFISSKKPVTFLRHVAWVIFNLCRNEIHPPNIDVIKQLLPALKMLITHTDTDILFDTVWAVSHLTDGGNAIIQLVIKADLVSALVPLLSCLEFEVQMVALRTIGNIVTGTDEQKQVVLDYNALVHFPTLLDHPRLKEAIRFLSNITAGNQQQIQAVIDHNLIPMIINNLANSNFQTQKEAVRAVSNMTLSGRNEQIMHLVSEGVIPPLCKMLSVQDSQVIQVALDGIHNMLKIASSPSKTEEIANMIKACGGLYQIEKLQNHENEIILRSTFQIIDNFFSEDRKDASLAPETTE